MEKGIDRHSLKYRFTRNILLILGISYLVIVGILMSYVRYYFYMNFFNTMKNNIVVSQKYYQNNVASSQTLVESVYSGDDTWWRTPRARVQIYNWDRKILMDSQAVLDEESPDLSEMNFNEKGDPTYRIFHLKTTGEHVMSVSVPLYFSGNPVGILRQISSLREVDRNLGSITTLFFLIGAMVTALASLISILMVESIIRPVTTLKVTAGQMAEGDYNVRTDITTKDEIGDLAKTFNYMASEIKKKENLKNEFISSVSHELRTPLTAIKGWAVTLKEPDIILQAADDIVNDRRSMLEDGLETIDKEAERLKGMVEELLDFSKFASGKIELKLTSINPGELASYIANFTSGRLERENKSFTVNLMEGTRNFTADENRIKQVLINLIDNAIKFTSPGDVIELNISQDDENTYLEVRDTGAGISKEDLLRVKERFFKGKHVKASNGIGLSICSEIAELHGGRLDVGSELGKWTSMLVVIPEVIPGEK